VCAILDDFYADPEHEPDWAAIHAKLMHTHESLYSVTIGLLKAAWYVYEDEQSGLSRIYAAKHGLL
jgi:hypothetical protein